MRLSTKLPLALVALALVTGVIIGVMAYSKSSSQLVTAAEEKLSALLEARRNAVARYLETISEDVAIMAENAMVVESVLDFQYALEFADGGLAMARQLFVTDNPHSAAERWKLDTSGESRFSGLHGRTHPTFRRYLQTRGYEDLYLIDTAGNVVYSVMKKDDYATSLVEGEWKDSSLAKVFRQAKDNPSRGAVVFSGITPYGPAGDMPVGFLGAPLLDGEEFLGVVVFQMPLSRINEVMQQSAGLGTSGETYLVGPDMTMRSDSRLATEPTMLRTRVDTPSVARALAGETGMHRIRNYRGAEALSAFGPLAFQGVTWAIIAEADQSEILAPVSAMRTFLIVGGLLVLVLAVVMGVVVARGIVRPISAMTSTMARLAEGDLSVEVPAVGRRDEIGEMAAAVQVFKTNAEDMHRLEDEQKEAQRRAEEEKRAALETLAADFEHNVGAVVGAVSDASERMQGSARSMAGTAELASGQASTVASAAQRATTNVETVAAAAEQLSGSIREISSQVDQSTRIAANAVEEAQRTNLKVEGLAEAASKIGAVVNMITDIAEQTNLLALNATIEAARAGDAGKGFAVVASEVKNLANQTAKATEEISAQIGGIQDATGEAVSAIRSIGKTIDEISSIASAIAAAVEQQGAATQEIARNVEEAAAGTREVSQSIGEVTRGAGETGQSANQVLASAQDLSHQADTMRQQVDAFLREIRTS